MKIVHGSDNVFKDLGFGDQEAHELQRKAKLMSRVQAFVKRHRLTQARAAQLLRISQPRVSDLVNGRMSRFSLDELARLCDRTGAVVGVTISHDATAEKRILRHATASTASRLGSGSKAARPNAKGE